MKQQERVLSDLELDVYQGLSVTPKKLSSRFFYDSLGDHLFQEIMELPEYYLTRLEHEILEKRKEDIIDLFQSKEVPFDLIDLGAGDAKKTKILLKALLERNITFRYVPVDISKSSLEILSRTLHQELPRLAMAPRSGTYHEVLQQMKSEQSNRRIFLLLGSNIGNLTHQGAVKLLSAIKETMQEEDLLFAGFDQKKNPATILAAYNDSAGITERFNKNLLLRINKELDADFDPDTFDHWPSYDPETGTVKSFLVSKKAQKIDIRSLSLEVPFQAWESIHMEIAQKYDDHLIRKMARESGLGVRSEIGDQNGFFKNYIFKKE